MIDQARKVILYLSHSADLYGAELCLLNLVTGLDRNQFLPIVVLPKNGPLKQKLRDYNVTVEVVPTITAWLTKRKGLQKFIHFLAVLPFIFVSVWRLKQIAVYHKVDLIHTNSQVIIDGALTAKILRVPHVWHARELLIPRTVFNFCLGPHAALSIVKHLSDQIIAMSLGVKQTFGQYDGSIKVEVVYDGLEPEAFNLVPPKVSTRADLGIPDDYLLIGEVGRVTAIKGYEDLVRAAAIVKKVVSKVMFIGIGSASKSDATYKQKLLNLVNTLDLQDSFKFIGYRDNVSEIMAELDLLVLPSHSEAFGRVLVEAMAVGKPVIGTNIGGIPEIIEDGVTGLLVPPHSPNDLAQAIIKVLQNPELARRMGTAGYKRAKSCFSLEQYITKIQAIYKTLMDQDQTTDC